MLLPPGRWLSATVHLRSGVTLELAAGARLIGHPDPTRYASDAEGSPERSGNWSRALILGVDCKDVAIVGAGTIDGNRVFDPTGEEKMRGPHTILLRRCTRTAIQSVTIVDSANYAVLYQGGRDASVRDCVIEGGWDGVHWRPSNGIDGEHLAITNCRFHTGDDAVAGANWNDLLIKDCVLNSSCNAVRLIGPARGVIITGCLMYGPGRHAHRTSGNTRSLAGLCLQPGGWGPMPGYFGDVVVSRCTMRDVSTALILMQKFPQENGPITISDIDATGVHRAPLSIESWGGTPWQQVSLQRVHVRYAADMASVAPETEITAPHVDDRALPVWGLYARAVTSLDLDDLRLDRSGSDVRPALRFDEVAELRQERIRILPAQ